MISVITVHALRHTDIFYIHIFFHMNEENFFDFENHKAQRAHTSDGSPAHLSDIHELQFRKKRYKVLLQKK